VIAFLVAVGIASAAQDTAFRLDPQRTTVNFTLGDVLHTVRGTFQLKQGSLRLDPASGKLTGEIVVDAKSGGSGSGMREPEDAPGSAGERPLPGNYVPARSRRWNFVAARKILGAGPWDLHHPRIGP
jgi:hypothetical protein